VDTIRQFPLRNPHRLEKLLQKHLARVRRFSMGRYTYHFLPPNGSPQSLRPQAPFPFSGLTIIPRRTRRMLEARDSFSSLILIIHASVIIKIMPPMIRHTRLRYQCRLMLILYETTLLLEKQNRKR
jgi:hypothetical protein